MDGKSVCVIVVLSFLCHSALATSTMKGAYWPSWSVDYLPPSAIEASYYTHLYYAFLTPNNVTFKFEVDDATALLLVNFTSAVRAKNPTVKTLFSVGGANDGPAYFSRMASTGWSRKSFIDSSIEVARKFGFDGVDLDWEFPQTPGDMVNFGVLIQEWRAEVKKEAKASYKPQLLLAAATYYSANGNFTGIPVKYPGASISKNLDWINAMNYDYYGKWTPNATGSHAALFDLTGNLSTSYGLKSWIKAGVPRRKVIMGLPLYGKTWSLKDPEVSGLGAPAMGIGPGPDGILTYFEIGNHNLANKATVTYDAATVSTYSVAGSTWIGYDDIVSITVKIGYAQSLRIGGYFFWALNGDHNWSISRTASQLWI
ncbi:hypothetical protein DCAR_0416017 [Daucus carota subsp. sativus]|uniref:GH18 domain-containing protein n=1 Tax=Daucus carota subsp. sativus TaxID=79200 RepID=A0A165X081_DAUCS|nr:hypothetical protein DCAR_0416017 [Daucus carota subsp. sativus]